MAPWHGWGPRHEVSVQEHPAHQPAQGMSVGAVSMPAGSLRSQVAGDMGQQCPTVSHLRQPPESSAKGRTSRAAGRAASVPLFSLHLERRVRAGRRGSTPRQRQGDPALGHDCPQIPPSSGEQDPAAPPPEHVQEDGAGGEVQSHPLPTRLTPAVFQVAELPAKEDAESCGTLLLLPERNRRFTPGASIWRPGRRRRAAGARHAAAPAAIPPSLRRGTRPLPAAASVPCQLMACPVASGTELRCCLQLMFYACSSAKSDRAFERGIFSWPRASPPLRQLPASPARLLPSAWGWGSVDVGTGIGWKGL